MPYLFSEADLALMRRVHDAFNPSGLLNPGKIFPSAKACGEIYTRPAAAPGNGQASGAPTNSTQA
jgi:glycolate oxidase